MSITTLVTTMAVAGNAYQISKWAIDATISGIRFSIQTIHKVLESNPKLTVYTEPIDLYAELEVMDAMVVSLSGYTMDKDETDINIKPIEISLYNLQKSINLIHEIIKKLNILIESHQQLYFYSWRTPSYLPVIDQLQSEWNIVLQRKQVLLQAIQFVANNVQISMANRVYKNVQVERENEKISNIS